MLPALFSHDPWIGIAMDLASLECSHLGGRRFVCTRLSIKPFTLQWRIWMRLTVLLLLLDDDTYVSYGTYVAAGPMVLMEATYGTS